jgi:hypothetical protein
MSILSRPVTVCDHCSRASCWLGIFLCDAAQRAGTKEMTVLELRNLAYEHPQYWFKNPHTGAVDQQAMREYEGAA